MVFSDVRLVKSKVSLTLLLTLTRVSLGELAVSFLLSLLANGVQFDLGL